eukprot:COSAG01_NODE_48_length_31904_cov_21.696997_17_plen_195_part_00
MQWVTGCCVSVWRRRSPCLQRAQPAAQVVGRAGVQARRGAPGAVGALSTAALRSAASHLQPRLSAILGAVIAFSVEEIHKRLTERNANGRSLLLKTYMILHLLSVALSGPSHRERADVRSDRPDTAAIPTSLPISIDAADGTYLNTLGRCHKPPPPRVGALKPARWNTRGPSIPPIRIRIRRGLHAGRSAATTC